MRYRRSGGEVREQIKWIAFAASVVALGVSGAVVLGTFAADTEGGTQATTDRTLVRGRKAVRVRSSA
jgi:hypothetical protein